MTSRAIRRLLCLCMLVVACAASAQPRVQHVVIVSMDGARPDMVQKSRMPVLHRMAQRGAYSWKAQTIFPSITLVSHTSMLTGVGPAKHHVDWNDWEPARGVVKVPTVFAVAKKAGLSTALFAGKEKFKHLNQPGTVDKFWWESTDAPKIGAQAAEYIRQAKPNLIFVHFPDPDAAGHKYGWCSTEQQAALAACDQGIARLIEGIRKAGIASNTVMIVTADHGGHAKTHGSHDPVDMTIPWVAFGTGVKEGQVRDSITTYDTSATALWLLGVRVPYDWDGKPVKSAFVGFAAAAAR